MNGSCVVLVPRHAYASMFVPMYPIFCFSPLYNTARLALLEISLCSCCWACKVALLHLRADRVVKCLLILDGIIVLSPK